MSNFVKLDIKALDSYQPLMVISPTGSGKTFSVIKYALKQNVYNKVVFAMPTKAAIREVYTKLSLFTNYVGRDDSDARLEDSFNAEEVWRKKIIVTSYERLLQQMISYPSLFSNSLLVIDEAHLLLSEGRNCTLQELLAYYKFFREKFGGKINIILLSATMPDVDSLSEYLEAKVICNDKRPVNIDVKIVRVSQKRSENYYLNKAIEFINYVKKGELKLENYKQILVYTNTRRSAEEISKLIEKELHVSAVFHHAGLPIEVRKKIEDDMRSENNQYKVIVSTDTLALSINTNVDVVVVLALKRFAALRTYVEPSTIAQVIGRAGRPGYSEKGLALIFAEPDEVKIVNKALKKDFGRVPEPLDYPQTVLRWIYSGLDPLLLARYGYRYSPSKIKDSLSFLENIGAIQKGKVTPLGKVFAYEMVPKKGMNLLKLIIKFDKKGNPLARALYYSFIYSFFVDEYFSRKVNEGEILRKGNSIFLDLVKSLRGSFGKYTYFTVGESLEPSTWFYYSLTVPQVISTDDIAESIRKSSEIIYNLSTYSLISEDLSKPSYFIMRLMRSYRRVIRGGKKGEEIVDFIRFCFSNYQELSKSKDEFFDTQWIRNA
ncbi:DEAD/DEAH box helicase [Acidianus infernus]|uniref:DEAD/DEAH box helicase n=1 Tax=Acidianus infernus TaxID=12915 RepID=UPI003594734A